MQFFFSLCQNFKQIGMYENEIQTDLDFEKFISRFFRVCLPFYKKNTPHTFLIEKLYTGKG